MLQSLEEAFGGLAESSDFTLWSVERPRKGLEQTDDVIKMPSGMIVLEALGRMRGRLELQAQLEIDCDGPGLGHWDRRLWKGRQAAPCLSGSYWPLHSPRSQHFPNS